MAAQSLLARLGLRLATLGSVGSLAIAAPIAEGNVSQTAHTNANCTGVYFPTATSVGFVAAGAERMRLYNDGGVQIGGSFSASPGANALRLNDVTLSDNTISGQTVLLIGSKTTTNIVTLRIVPGAAANTSSFEFFSSSTPNNSNRFLGVVNANGVFLASDKTGTGTAVPMVFRAGPQWDSAANSIVIGTNGYVALSNAFSATPPNPVYPVQIGDNGFQRMVAYSDGGIQFGGPYTASPGADRVMFANDILVHGMTVGLGNGAGITNAVMGSEALLSNTTGTSNIAIGRHAMRLASTASGNVAIGEEALATTVGSTANVAIGYAALNLCTSGFRNVAIGSEALTNITSGSTNIAIGFWAGRALTTTNDNIAFGYRSLEAATSSTNIALGSYSLTALTTGNNNLAIGYNALGAMLGGGANIAIGSNSSENMTVGSFNTALGFQTLQSATNTSYNSAFGFYALRALTTGIENTACGAEGLEKTTTGSYNATVGLGALYNNLTGSYNTAVGYNTAGDTGLTTLDHCTFIGHHAYASVNGLTNSTAIGNEAFVTASNQVVIGNSSVTETLLRGTVITDASTTTRAGLRLDHGFAPSSPVDGDLWSTALGFYGQVSGVTVGPFGVGGGGTPAGSNTEVQFNNGGVFGADSGLTWDGSLLTATSMYASSITADTTLYIGLGGDRATIVTETNGMRFTNLDTNPADVNNVAFLFDLTNNLPIARFFGMVQVDAQALPATPVAGYISIDSGDSNKLKWYDGSAWQNAGGVSTPPAGANTQIQYNNAGVFGATPNFTYSTAGGAPSVAISSAFPATGANVSALSVSASRSPSSGSTSHVGVEGVASMSGAGFAADASNATGGYFRASSSNTAATSQVIKGLKSQAAFSGVAGVVNKLICLEGSVDNSGTATEAFGAAIALNNSGTVTNSYGIHLDVSNNSGTITNSYGIYQLGSSATNFFAGSVRTSASTTTRSGLNIAPGVSPSSPVDGDIWVTTSGVYGRVNGVTRGPFESGTIGGSITANQIAVGSGTNTISGSASLTATTTGGGLKLSHTGGTVSSGASNIPFVSFTGTDTHANAVTTVGGIYANYVFNGGGANSSVYGLDLTLGVNPSASLSGTSHYGIRSLLSTNCGSTNQYASSQLYGYDSNVNHTATGTSGAGPTLTGSRIAVNLNGTVGTYTVATVRCLDVNVTANWTGGGSLAVTDLVGVYIGVASITNSATVTNRYGIYQADSAAINLFSGDVRVSTAGKGLFIKEGSNAKMGIATLVAGSVVVGTTAVGANSRIFLTSNSDGGTNGFVRVSSRINNTAFTITSSDVSDTSQIAWMIVDPA